METTNANILIVDDIPENLQILGNILSRQGYNLSFAEDGKDALTAVSQTEPDLILLDVSMPEIDGFEVCRILKQNALKKHIPIIFLTALTETSHIIKGFSVGAADFVTKPFNTHELIARIKTHLEIKFARDIIENQKQHLEHLNATKDKFFSIIAHDLKNPFATLISSSELLQLFLNNDNVEKAKAKANLIYEASKKGYLLLQNLLEWAQSQRGDIIFSPTQLSLNELVSEIILLLENQAVEKNIKLENKIERQLEVTADRAMLQIIIRNLLTNAIKFTNTDGFVSISATEKVGFFEVLVQDSGIGMAAETIEKLFKIESKTSIKGTKGETGTGLGLHLCKEFIEKHNGKIWTESVKNEGSKFYFTLPIK